MTQMVYPSGADPREIKDIPGLVRYAATELGCQYPVGNQRKGVYINLAKEMKAQGWKVNDLVKTVRYCKAHKIRINKVWGLTYHVHDAKEWKEEEDTFDLQVKVGNARRVETDEDWLRRLTLAGGKALERVYKQWVEERGKHFGIDP